MGECDENGVEIEQVIVVTEVQNVVTDVTMTDMTVTEATSVEDLSEVKIESEHLFSTIENISLSNEEFEKDQVLTVENFTEMNQPKINSAPEKFEEAEVSVIENNLFESSGDIDSVSGSGS